MAGKRINFQCVVRDCKNNAVAHGLCPKHYKRVSLYGDSDYVKQVQYHGLSLKERLYARITITEHCWIWTGYKDPNGYGRINVKNKPLLAHRLSWIVHHGAIPEGMNVLHHCDNPICVRPDHLFLGSQDDNIQDAIKKGRDDYGLLRGEKHGCAKLNNAQVLEIRNSNETGVFLAKKYNVSTTTISDITKRKIWKHI